MNFTYCIGRETISVHYYRQPKKPAKDPKKEYFNQPGDLRKKTRSKEFIGIKVSLENYNCLRLVVYGN